MSDTACPDTWTAPIFKPEGRLASNQVADLWLANATPFTLDGKPARKVLATILPDKDENFREVVKGNGFMWAVSRWQREITPRMGDPLHRLAELAHELLEAGFMVRLRDREASDLALSGEFEPERTRWVELYTFKSGEKKFGFTWARKDDLYQKVKELPGAQYADGRVYVPLGAAEEVGDFAASRGFTLTHAASDAIRGHHEAILASITVKPRKPKAVAAPARAPATEGIHDDLLDD